MADTTRVNFTRPAAERIAAAVRTVERGDRDQSALRFARPASSDTISSGAGIRLFTFSGAWAKGATKVVTRIKGDGTAISPPDTFSVINHFSTLSGSCGSRKGAAAYVGSTWVMIAVECV